MSSGTMRSLAADRSRPDLPVHLPHDVCPPVDNGQDRVRLLGWEHRHDAGDAHLRQALHPIRIFAECERGDLDRSRIAAGVPRHLAEFRQDLADIATWNPTIAIADRAPCAMRESTADMDRRMRFLDRFGPGDHRVEIHELAVIFRL